MSKYKLRIELLSDLCVSDGSGYTSMLDTDICYDSLGFPYIPARRIKGCLRECSLELNEWGMTISTEKLFGKEGETGAAVHIRSAYLEDYEKWKKEVEEHKGHVVYHPQNVLNQFSYIRTQTAINYETGVAEDHSLRTMRVANKGSIFVADVELSDKYKDDFENCCKILTEMGIARTRGLGEVKVSLIKNENTTNTELKELNNLDLNGANYLAYKIYIEEPVICKNIRSDAETMDYIEGGRILGMFLSKDASLDGIVCSNAYIGNDNVRFTEVPGNYYAIKNDKEKYINKIYGEPSPDEKLQLNQMKHAYVDLRKENLKMVTVALEERYHHRRPEDKSIGRAVETVEEANSSTFYQMSSISSGQELYGYIKGTASQIEKIYKTIATQKEFYIGNSKNTEYGKVQISVVETKKIEENTSKTMKKFIVKLEAPTIVYNNKAMYSIAIEDLKAEVAYALGIPELTNGDKCIAYMKYVTLGGFNVKWDARKPEIEAFDKGSVLYYEFETEKEIKATECCYIGERNFEGYGEISIKEVVNKPSYTECYEAIENTIQIFSELVVPTGSLAADICKKLFVSYVEVSAVKNSQTFLENVDKPEKYRSTVNNILLLTKEKDSLEEIEQALKKRYKSNTEKKEEKLGYANEIMEKYKENVETIEQRFCKEYMIEWAIESDETMKFAYLKAFLVALKYEIRKLTNQKGEE